ncbi:MAG: M48 family metallopeptidase [Elusimicrobia bacterium]|nr:M48 family metallopeptidase [Elusimicrobiota bacterium]
MIPRTAPGTQALFLAFLWTCPLLFSGCATVPYTGRKRLLLLSEGEELALGKRAYQEVLQNSRLAQNPEALAHLKRVGERLAEVSGKARFDWEFNLIEDDKTINAFVLPGGKVAVYTGILKATQDEAGLAVVLGHEIGHAVARHGAERISQQLLVGLGGTALQVLLAGKDPGTQRALHQAYGVGTGLGVILPFSRKHEAEADHIGLLLMAKAGYDPEAAVSFWERMENLSKDRRSPASRYFSTHPTHRERIANIQKLLPEARKYLRLIPDVPK